MPFNLGPTTASTLAEFADAMAARGGSVPEAFDDGERLFARSVLPRVETVRPRDGFRGGVALRACGGDVWLHPYLFRLVCTNGAVMARTVSSRHLTNFFAQTPDEAADSLREAVEACSADEAFATALGHVRTAAETEMDMALVMMPLLSRLSESAGPLLVSQVLSTFFRDRDHTRYGLMNAVTATARDTADPQLRWDLEELGGAIAVGTPAPGRRPPAAAERRELAGAY